METLRPLHRAWSQPGDGVSAIVIGLASPVELASQEPEWAQAAILTTTRRGLRRGGKP